MRPSFFVSISVVISNKRFRKRLIYAVCKVVVMFSPPLLMPLCYHKTEVNSTMSKIFFKIVNLGIDMNLLVCYHAEHGGGK